MSNDDRVVVIGGPESLAQTIDAGGHELVADEPRSVPGGTNTGTTPYGLLLAALGACTSMTLRMYAERKGLQLGNVEVTLEHDRVYADDCASCETQRGKIDVIRRFIKLTGELSEDDRERLLKIADKCPVHRTLTSETVIETRLADA